MGKKPKDGPSTPLTFREKPRNVNESRCREETRPRKNSEQPKSGKIKPSNGKEKPKRGNAKPWRPRCSNARTTSVFRSGNRRPWLGKRPPKTRLSSIPANPSFLKPRNAGNDKPAGISALITAAGLFALVTVAGISVLVTAAAILTKHIIFEMICCCL